MDPKENAASKPPLIATDIQQSHQSILSGFRLVVATGKPLRTDFLAMGRHPIQACRSRIAKPHVSALSRYYPQPAHNIHPGK
jgi:hypothetical protein